MRIQHWVKNLIIFIPLIFSLHFTDMHSIKLSTIAFLAFCLISSVVYIINDILDIAKDKLHPIKKERPLASGKVDIKTAILLATALFLASLALVANLGLVSILILLAYFILNVFYSKSFKHKVIFDVFCIAFGFILRVLIGCSAINVAPSAFIILTTIFVSLFFGFSKRKLELSLSTTSTRKSLLLYNQNILEQFILFSAVLSIAFYSMYCVEPEVVARLGAKYLYFTVIPFVYLILRFLYLINSFQQKDDPLEIILDDKYIIVTTVIYFLTVLATIVL